MPVLETISSVALAVGKIFGFSTKLIQPDKIRIDNHEIAKPRLEGKELIKIYDKQYIRLKDHDEIDIATDVNLIYDSMAEDQRKEMIENLTNRIFKYRNKWINRFRFKEFLKSDIFVQWKNNHQPKPTSP